MKKLQSHLSAGIVLAGLALVSCGGAEQQPATESTQTQTQAPAQSQTAQTPAAEAAVYPIDWCIVSGEKLGSMGDPVVHTYNGKTVQFCCKRCVDIFEKAPDAFIAKLDSAATGLLESPHGHDHDSHDGHTH